MRKITLKKSTNDFSWLVKNSFSYIWTSRNILSLGAVLLVLWSLMVFVFPIVFDGLSSWYNATSWFGFATPGFLIMIAVFGSIVGEHVAIYSETNYILTKNISRKKFLFAKCLVSFLATFIFAMLLFACLVVVYFYLYFANNHEFPDMFSKGRDWYGFISTSIIISFFSSSISVLTKYCFRQWTYMLLSLLVIIIYAVLFPIIYDINDNTRDGEKARELFITFCPILLILLNMILYFIFEAVFERRLIQV